MKQTENDKASRVADRQEREKKKPGNLNLLVSLYAAALQGALSNPKVNPNEAGKIAFKAVWEFMQNRDESNHWHNESEFFRTFQMAIDAANEGNLQ